MWLGPVEDALARAALFGMLAIWLGFGIGLSAQWMRVMYLRRRFK